MVKDVCEDGGDEDGGNGVYEDVGEDGDGGGEDGGEGSDQDGDKGGEDSGKVG